MLPSDRLRDKLLTLEGKGYAAYKALSGTYRFPRYVLYIDHVQPDPFAPPSLIRIRVDMAEAQFPAELWRTQTRKVALEDFIARRVADAIRAKVRGRRGTGRSGVVEVDAGGQEILARTACRLHEEHVEVRMAVGLPSEGRKIMARDAQAIFLDEVPAVVDASLLSGGLEAATRHVEVAEDHQALQDALEVRGLIAFVADGAILPRESGILDLPLPPSRAVAFRAPEELAVTLHTPNRGVLSGMGVPKGVTLIVGGAFHGKSTLVSAMSRCVYPHIPGDGREYVAAAAHAVKIRAEDGRRVARVDISPFIGTLPTGMDTRDFSTENASGSTSQAANMTEAIEAGARVLLIDEDTSATNLMIRDGTMQRLVPKSLEPITPFVDQVRELYERHGVSTVLAIGGSSDYFEVADTVILMDNYTPRVVTQQARRLATERLDRRVAESRPFDAVRQRVPQPHGFNPYRSRRIKVDARGLRTIAFGRDMIDLSAIEQVVDSSQTRAIGDAIFYALERGYFDGERTLGQVLDALMEDLTAPGLEVLSLSDPSPDTDERRSERPYPGDYALPRRFEIAAAINRLRTLSVRQLERPASTDPAVFSVGDLKTQEDGR